MRCHQCSGAACETITSISPSAYCQNYDAEDSCYSVGTNIDGVDHIHRGCMSDTGAGKDLCTLMGEDCQICTEADCNRNNLKTPSELTCVTCDTATDPSCRDFQGGVEGKACEYNLFPGQEDQCFTFHHVSGRVSRGCLYSEDEDLITQCLVGHQDCQICEYDNCNVFDVQDNGRCLNCDSRDDERCVTGEGLTPINCPSGQNPGCFLSKIGMISAHLNLSYIIMKIIIFKMDSSLVVVSLNLDHPN